MLLRLATGDLDNWQLFFYNPQDDESVVVKIINSITEQQADKFLDRMLESQSVNVSTEFFGTTKIAIGNLFNIFYKSINNTTLGLGKDNLTKFIMSMYQVWTVSNYNPYKDGVFNQDNLVKFTYNHEIGTNPDPNTNWWKDVLQLDENKLNFNASPIILNYNSSNIGGFYLDNFNFYFNSDRAFYGGNEMLFSTGFGSRFINLNEAPTGNKIFAVKKNYTEDGKDGLYGTYDYYQPVMLADSNQEAAIKIPVINGKNEVIIDGESQKINSLVPIFVLKYIDDIGDESDFFKVVGYTVDIISIVAGGYGAITKLKYLRSLSGFTPEIISGTESGSTLIFTLYLSPIIDGIQLLSSTVSFLIKLTGDHYKNEPWYKTLVTTVSWIEFLSGGGSVLADKLLKTSSKNLVNELNSLPSWPEEFIIDPRGILARQTLTRISGVVVELLPAVNRKVHSLLEELWFKETKGTFSKSTMNGSIIHSEEAISEIIQIGYREGLPAGEIAELIHISYRRKKIIPTSQLMLQVRFYAYVRRIKKYPAGFSSIEKYQDFCSDIADFWDLKFIEFSNTVGVEFKNIKYEMAIQGSAVRTRLPTDPLPNASPADFAGLNSPDDIEFVMLMEKYDFDMFLDNMKNFVMENITNAKNKRTLLDNVKYARRKGNFSYGNFDLIDETILTEMGTKGGSSLTGLNKIGFSITQKGSRLDLGPYIPFKYN